MVGRGKRGKGGLRGLRIEVGAGNWDGMRWMVD